MGILKFSACYLLQQRNFLQLIISCFIHFSIALSISFLFSFKNTGIMQQVHKRQSSSLSQIETNIYRLINAHRASIGLKPLQESNVESSAAVEHSNNMALGKITFGHEGFQKRIKAIAGKVGNISASAENVAFGQMSAGQVVDLWLQSPQHRKNMEGDFTHTGIGVARANKGMLYFTEIFTR
jgi:uncharacterized protein YkwD